MTYLVTGSAGFIGFHVAKKLLNEGNFVIGIDNFNDYYDVSIKESRNIILEKYEKFKLLRGDISDLNFVKNIFKDFKIDKVCHLAAQAGVRFSIKNPYIYVNSNIVGFINVINESKNAGVKDFIYASSSSVYGEQGGSFSEGFETSKPISLYAATKKTNEAVAHSYHHLFGMNCTGLRFFTVYGPWGRPDMAIFSFTKDIIDGRPIKIFNNGEMLRDFTYIDDIVDGVICALDKCHKFEIINLGNGNPVKLSKMVEILEDKIGKIASKEFLPVQPGDVVETRADIKKAKEKLGWTPGTNFKEGLKKFVDWYKDYYKYE